MSGAFHPASSYRKRGIDETVYAHQPWCLVVGSRPRPLFNGGNRKRPARRGTRRRRKLPGSPVGFSQFPDRRFEPRYVGRLPQQQRFDLRQYNELHGNHNRKFQYYSTVLCCFRTADRGNGVRIQSCRDQCDITVVRQHCKRSEGLPCGTGRQRKRGISNGGNAVASRCNTCDDQLCALLRRNGCLRKWYIEEHLLTGSVRRSLTP